MTVISIISYLSWQVKCHAKTSLSSFEQILESLVCLISSTKTSILSHSPKPITIHSRMYPPCEWILSGLLILTARFYFRIVEFFHSNVGISLYFFCHLLYLLCYLFCGCERIHFF